MNARLLLIPRSSDVCAYRGLKVMFAGPAVPQPPLTIFHDSTNGRSYCSILIFASLMILAYFATSARINAVTSSGFEMKASDPCLIR